MARIFNIYFNYNDTSHNAIVSVRTTPFYAEYTLNIVDESLLAYLPGNKIISPSPKHFVFPNATPENSVSLMNEIIKAVKNHLLTVGPPVFQGWNSLPKLLLG